jgi:hypothetical protein
MKHVYAQPYRGGHHISGYYGKPPKGQFKYDTIKLHLGRLEKDCKCGGFVYMTPDEAVAMIRALSASLHFWTVENTKKIIKAKNK